MVTRYSTLTYRVRVHHKIRYVHVDLLESVELQQPKLSVKGETFNPSVPYTPVLPTQHPTKLPTQVQHRDIQTQ
jgi:hypothetical protein